jgi:hypothetical protein
MKSVRDLTLGRAKGLNALHKMTQGILRYIMVLYYKYMEPIIFLKNNDCRADRRRLALYPI